MKTAIVGARVPGDLITAVTKLSAMSGQSISSIAEEALREYVGWRVPQILDLKEAIAAAESGEFATDEEANTFFRQYGAQP
jgi:predicted transcriptional regulator